jgi:hypothetical protein
MKLTVHKANTRGLADHGWLKSAHSFSFASYYNPERMGFGLLRVLNDDQVIANEGFGTHPHKDMEIVSIPLSGSLKHKDSEGNDTVIRHGEVQIMSAGKGVFHSEYNNSETEDVNFLQIWVMPEEKRIKPRYDQKKFDISERKNKFQTIVSPLGSDAEGVKINQQAYFSLVDLDEGEKLSYKNHNPENGIFVFLLEGKALVANTELERRDAAAIEDALSVELSANEEIQALIIEVPMN